MATLRLSKQASWGIFSWPPHMRGPETEYRCSQFNPRLDISGQWAKKSVTRLKPLSPISSRFFPTHCKDLNPSPLTAVISRTGSHFLDGMFNFQEEVLESEIKSAAGVRHQSMPIHNVPAKNTCIPYQTATERDKYEGKRLTSMPKFPPSIYPLNGLTKPHAVSVEW